MGCGFELPFFLKDNKGLEIVMKQPQRVDTMCPLVRDDSDVSSNYRRMFEIDVTWNVTLEKTD